MLCFNISYLVHQHFLVFSWVGAELMLKAIILKQYVIAFSVIEICKIVPTVSIFRLFSLLHSLHDFLVFCCKFTVYFFFTSVENFSVILELSKFSILELWSFWFQSCSECNGCSSLVDQVISCRLQLFFKVDDSFLLHLIMLFEFQYCLLLLLNFHFQIDLICLQNFSYAFIDNFVEVIHLRLKAHHLLLHWISLLFCD